MGALLHQCSQVLHEPNDCSVKVADVSVVARPVSRTALPNNMGNNLNENVLTGASSASSGLEEIALSSDGVSSLRSTSGVAPRVMPLGSRQQRDSSPFSRRTNSNRNDPQNSTERPKVIPNLAALAASVVRLRQPEHPVGHIEQMDMQSWTVKRTKLGTKINVFVILDGTELSFKRGRFDSDKRSVNVRANKVQVNKERMELVVHKQGRERPFRFQIMSEDACEKWEIALRAALNSDIKDFYTLGQPLGKGAYGEVVRAVHVRSNNQRAVKIIKRGANLKSREHLSREIEIMKSISHPGIVQTYEIFDLKRTIYIVMEFVPGGELFDFVAQHEVLTEAQSSQTMSEIFRAVAYLHAKNIVHRDLKPENILCVEKSWPLEIKITDFGFSGFLDPQQDELMRTPVGTAYFMAPEIITNRGHGQAVDLWACGVILYTILTGRLPFPGRNRNEYFENVRRGRAMFPQTLWKGISSNAVNLVKGLLNMDPDKRLTALGALQHRWVSSPNAYASERDIRRDRSNLHSERRRLYKARASIIAVAMAQKMKATIIHDFVEKIPEVVDKVGEGTIKVAQNLEKGVKKTADGLGEGVKKTKDSVKEVSDRIGEGTRRMKEKTADGVEKGARKVGENMKKTADGIGTGVKKTADGIKKTADEVGSGAKKAAGSIGTGVKKTTQGIGTGIRKTGEGIKKVKIDREMLERLKIPVENLRPRFGDSQGSFTQESSSQRRGEGGRFRRRNRGVGSESATYRNDGSEIFPSVAGDSVGEDGTSESKTDRTVDRDDDTRGNSSDGFYSAPETWNSQPSLEKGPVQFPSQRGKQISHRTSAHLEIEAMPAAEAQIGPCIDVPQQQNNEPTQTLQSRLPTKNEHKEVLDKRLREAEIDVEKQSSNISSTSGGSNRPKVAPLELGLIGHSNTDSPFTQEGEGDSFRRKPANGEGVADSDQIRKAAALLLATSNMSIPVLSSAKTDVSISPGKCSPPSAIDSPGSSF